MLVKVLVKGFTLACATVAIAACATMNGPGMADHNASAYSGHSSSNCVNEFHQICYAECEHVNGNGKSIQHCVNECVEKNRPAC